MAIRAGVPVVPVSVIGAQQVQPKGASVIRPGVVKVIFHPPIPSCDYSLDTRDSFIVRAHAAVASALPEDQRPAREL
jgi:1-acyl-sn-glycerol-3-phosphate acyltransferase